MNIAKFRQLRLDGLIRALVDTSLLPVFLWSATVNPSPKAEAGRRADCSRVPVICGAGLGLELTGEASAEPAIPSESAVAVAMTAIALNFMVSSGTRSPQPGPLTQPRGATIVEAEPGDSQSGETVIKAACGGLPGGGVYESWFVSARDPVSPRALWIRHTRHRPRAGRESVALWCTVIDRDDGRQPTVIKEVLGAFLPGTAAGPGQFRGQAMMAEHRARWDLTVAGEQTPLRSARAHPDRRPRRLRVRHQRRHARD